MDIPINSSIEKDSCVQGFQKFLNMASKSTKAIFICDLNLDSDEHWITYELAKLVSRKKPLTHLNIQVEV